MNMESFGGPAQPFLTISEALAAGYMLLTVKCRRCSNYLGNPQEIFHRRSGNTEFGGVEPHPFFQKCEFKTNYTSPVGLMRLTDTAELWYPAGEDR